MVMIHKNSLFDNNTYFEVEQNNLNISLIIDLMEKSLYITILYLFYYLVVHIPQYNFIYVQYD